MPASTAVERNANKMARVSNRSSPLMETLGGLAVAGRLMYGGYRVVAMGSDSRAAFSLTAFLLAYGRPTAGAAQYRTQQQPGRRAEAVRNRRQPGERDPTTATSRR